MSNRRNVSDDTFSFLRRSKKLIDLIDQTTEIGTDNLIKIFRRDQSYLYDKKFKKVYRHNYFEPIHVEH